MGNARGMFFWFKGQGKGKFLPKPEQIKGGGAPLRIQGRQSDPFVIDWDGDGSLDLVSGSSDGGVYWARNKAGKGKLPDLEPFRPLIKPWLSVQPGRAIPKDDLMDPTRVIRVHAWGGAGTVLGREDDLPGPLAATRVWVADVNGDGKLDLLVGDRVSFVVPAKAMSDVEFRKKYANWEKDFLAAMAAADSARDEKSRKKAIEEFDKVFGQRSAFMREVQTGFVWLHLQK